MTRTEITDRITRRNALRAGAVGLTFGLAGCVQDISRVSQDAARTVKQTVPGLDRTEGRTIDPGTESFPMACATVQRSNAVDFEGPRDGVQDGWRFRSGRDRISQPVIADGTVAAVGADITEQEDDKYSPGTLYALEPTSGELRWRYSAVPGAGDAVVHEGTVYGGANGIAADAGSGGMHLSDWNSDPEQQPDVWEPNQQVSGTSAPVPVGDRLLVHADHGPIYAVGSADGAVQWRSDQPSSGPAPTRVTGNMAYTGTRIWYYDAGNEYVVAYLPDRESFDIYVLDGPPIGSPVIADSTLYGACDAESDGFSLIGFGITDGERLIEREWEGASIAASPATTESSVAVPLTDGRIVVPRPERIDNVWTASVEGLPTGITRAGATIYVSVADRRKNRGNLVAIDATSGEKLWSYTTDVQLATAPAVTDTAVFVGDAEGTVHGLETV